MGAVFLRKFSERYVQGTLGIEAAFLSKQGFLFFPLLPREASKRVPIFDRGTGSKPENLLQEPTAKGLVPAINVILVVLE